MAVQQLVAIARAISTDVKVLVLDEPTSSLDLNEVAELFRVIRELKKRGVAILFVSHFLDQVYEICDRVTVLRDGRLVGEYRTSDLLRVDLVQKMLGHEVSAYRASPSSPAPEGDGTTFFSARGITAAPGIADADLDIAEGEVLGLAGLLGSGRTQLARAMTGVDRLQAGTIRIEQRDENLSNPRRAMTLGVVYSPEDRRADGIVSQLSVLENITLSVQSQRGILRRISTARQRELAASWVEALDIRPPDLDRPPGSCPAATSRSSCSRACSPCPPGFSSWTSRPAGSMSGRRSRSRTSSRELAANGLSVVFVSAELEEVLRVGDRVAVLKDGRIVETVRSADVSVDQLLALVARPSVPEPEDGRD